MRRFAILAATLVLPFLGAGMAHGAESARLPTPAPVKGILEIRRFSLQTPFSYLWSSEKIEVSSGALVVLEVDPEYVVPTNSLAPVLYAGDLPVQRLSQGDKSGRVLALVPGNVELATTPIWFGTPGLPGRVSADTARAERSKAEKAGLRALPQSRLAAATGPVIEAHDLAALLRTVGADLVLKYSPQEKQLAEAWRLPIARAPSKK